MTKERSAVELDVPPAVPSEATFKEWSTVSAADRNVPPAAPFEATLKERSAVDRRVPPAASFEATVRERSAADRHVPSATPLDATIKDRSAVELDVPPPVSPARCRTLRIDMHVGSCSAHLSRVPADIRCRPSTFMCSLGYRSHSGPTNNNDEYVRLDERAEFNRQGGFLSLVQKWRTTRRSRSMPHPRIPGVWGFHS